jgi:hypothetical protein
MAAPIDSAAVVAIGNQTMYWINILYPIVISIIAYITGHKYTSRRKLPPFVNDLKK